MNDFILADRIEATVCAINKIQERYQEIIDVSNYIIDSYNAGGKTIIFGNGGSAADAQHFAAELVCKYKMNRDPIPAMALTTDTSILTAWSNDVGYDSVFSRQIEAFAGERDTVIGISTSGTSPNVINGLRTAKVIGSSTVLLTGDKPPKQNLSYIDQYIKVDSKDTPVIQEAHIVIIHIICDLVERALFGLT